MNRLIAKIFICTFMATMSYANANDLDGISVYRGVDDELTEQSKHNLLILRRAAVANGRIDIWVTFDVFFEGNPEKQTKAVINKLHRDVRRAYNKSVLPIIRRGEAVEGAVPDQLLNAPGRPVSISSNGLASLMLNYRVKHVTYFVPPK